MEETAGGKTVFLRGPSADEQDERHIIGKKAAKLGATQGGGAAFTRAKKP